MRHVCWVVSGLRGGGAERSSIRTVNGLSERGYTVDLVLFKPINDFPGELSERVSVFVLSRRPDKLTRIRRRVANLLRKRKKRYPSPAFIDSCNTQWPVRHLPLVRLPGLLIRFVQQHFTHHLPIRDLARRQRRGDFIRALRLGLYFEERKPDIAFTTPVIADKAGFFAAEMTRDCPEVVPICRGLDPLNTKRDYFAFSAAPKCVAVSHGVADVLPRVAGVPADNITVLYNPVCAPDICELAEEEPDHPWFWDGGPPVILGVGRLSSQKDFPTLIDAFHHVRTSRPCRLVILGDGSLRPELEAHIARLDLEGCVSLPGFSQNPFAFMARSALFVLSSSFEGLPTVLVEALACGCPVVSTDCPSGPAEILGDPALLVPVGDAEALARVVLRALDQPVDKAALRASAARFSAERGIDGYERLISDVLARRKRPLAACDKTRNCSPPDVDGTLQ